MELKKYKHLFFIVIGLVITTTLYFAFIKSSYFVHFVEWSKEYFFIYFFLLVVIKSIGIIWPPIPGGILTLGSIPVIGWYYAYLADFIGSMIGSSIAFYLGKKYGFTFLEKLFDSKTLEKLKSQKVKKHKEFEAIFLMRILGGTLIEVVCYGAGLLKIRYSTFIVASAISHIVFGVPTYFVANNIFTFRNVLVNVLTLIVAILLLRKMKGRYFE